MPSTVRFVVALGLVVLLSVAPALAQTAASKEELHAQLVSLRDQIDAAKASGSASLATLMTQYRNLSAQLGGDQPAAVGVAGPAPRAPRVVPTAPPNCSAGTVNFAQTTPVAIPTGPAVVTSTILVSGANPFLWDVDLTTNMTHSFAADLDVTLMSPAGTIVTLTTDNGAGNDNVFNGTLWDDDADADGQVPYTANDGMVTDGTYVNLTTETPIVIEEALAAFVGEDPNGTWTITISDDLTGDGGSLDSWALSLTTFPSAPVNDAVTSATNSTPVAIPTGPAVVTSTITIAGAGTAICDINVTTGLQHSFAADLDITLLSPAGTIVTLTTDNGAGNDNVFDGTVWDDDANPGGQVPYTTNNGTVTDHAYVNLTLASPLVPEEALGAFLGENPNGTWTVTISDDLAGDGGSLNNWSLDIVTCSCPSADASITKTDGAATEVPGTTVTYTIAASNAGPSAITGGTVADTFPAALTGCTWTCVGAGGGTCAANGAGNINDSVNLPSGGTATYTATCTIAASATGSLSNTATVTHSLPDPVPGNNSATDTDTLAPEADLGVTKTDGLTNATPGQGSTYTIVVSNAGPSNDPSVAVADTFPAAFTGATWTCVGAGGGTCTANGAGNIADTANLPAGGSVTYTVAGTISGAFTGTLSNTATATASVTDPNAGNNSATDDTTVGTPTNITGTKTVAGTFEVGGAITYTVILSNSGQTPQPDNAGDEFTDTLPVGTTLTGASASSGTAGTAGNTVTWNGTIPGNGSVTITIDATIDAGTEGLTLSNQGTFSFDADGNGSNETSGTTDDPRSLDPSDPTDLVVGGINPLEIPTASEWGLMLLALMLAGLGFGVIRRRG